MAFDPDSYLKEPSQSGQTFNPDEYLQSPRVDTDQGLQSKKPISPKEITGAGVGGALFGAASPELFQAAGRGLSYVPYAPAKAAGAALQTIGTGMRPYRGTEAALGGLGAAGGETARQMAERAGYGRTGQTVAELGGGLVTGMAPQLFGPAASKTYGALKTFFGGKGETLSEAAKKEMGQIRERIRGEETGDAAQQTYETLKSGAGRITQRGEAERAQAEQRAAGMVAQAETQAAAAPKIIEQARQKISTIGDPNVESSTIGEATSKKINSRFTVENLDRDVNYQAQQKIRDDIVAKKEAAGQFIEDTQPFKKLKRDLEAKLLIGKAGLAQPTAQVTERGVLNAYETMYNAMIRRRVPVSPQQATALRQKGLTVVKDENTGQYFREFPTSFKALDDVRRKLGDVAFGKEVEGYGALQAKQAEKLYKQVSDVQSKFAGEAHDKLQRDYEIASRLIEKYKTARGAKVTAKDKYDLQRLATDPASLPATFFSSRQGVKDLVELTGDPRFVQSAASDWVARNLRDKKTSDQVKSWLTSRNNADFLSAPELAPVKAKADQYLQGLLSAEGKGKTIEQQAAKLRSEAPGVVRGGERASAEAQRRADFILGSSFPEQRIAEIITSGNPKLWDEVAPIIMGSPKGKETFGKALNQVVSDMTDPSKAGATPTKVLDRFTKDIAPALRSTKLVPEEQIVRLQSELERINKLALGEKEKLGFMKRALVRLGSIFIGGAVGAGATSAVSSLVQPQTIPGVK